MCIKNFYSLQKINRWENYLPLEGGENSENFLTGGFNND